jgi:osmotically-inducible protein OsmY
MTFPRHRLPAAAALLAAILALPACDPTQVAAGAGATVLVAAAQERDIGDAVDDKTIQLSLNARLLEKDAELFARVESEVVEGRVLLTGNVPRPEHRIEAARLIWQVPGVREVLNEIAINDRSGVVDYFKDSWITTQLIAKLLTDSEIFEINYSVETVNGIVYLMGIAQSPAEIERVTNHARGLAGVRRVISHVHTKDDPKRKSPS